MSDPLRLLLAALDLERLQDEPIRQPLRGQPAESPATPGPMRFRARSVPGWSARIFGGQFLAQAVIAAGRTVGDGKEVHSLHGYFVRAGDPALPLDYEVSAVRDGRSFATRRVEAGQDGAVRFVALVSFAAPEPGLDYQAPVDLSGVPGPEALRTYGEWMAETTDRPEDHYETQSRPRPVEVRYVDPPANPPERPVTGPQRMWLRLPGPLPGDPLVHAAALAYASDETLVDNTMLPHGRRWSDPALQGASLDHAMWFCRPSRADRWLLFEQTVVSTAGGRGLARGDLYTPGGELVATATQEGLIRLVG
jgi:acyl-CoA thioesterase-2